MALGRISVAQPACALESLGQLWNALAHAQSAALLELGCGTSLVSGLLRAASGDSIVYEG